MLSRVSRVEQQHPKMLASSFALYPQDDNRYRFREKYFLAGCARGREILVLAALVGKPRFMEGLLMSDEGLCADVLRADLSVLSRLAMETIPGERISTLAGGQRHRAICQDGFLYAG